MSSLLDIPCGGYEYEFEPKDVFAWKPVEKCSVTEKDVDDLEAGKQLNPFEKLVNPSKELIEQIYKCNCGKHFVQCGYEKWNNYLNALKNVGVDVDTLQNTKFCYCGSYKHPRLVNQNGIEKHEGETRHDIKSWLGSALKNVSYAGGDPNWCMIMEDKIVDAIKWLEWLEKFNEQIKND